jgi:hypothetical protein
MAGKLERNKRLEKEVWQDRSWQVFAGLRSFVSLDAFR